MAEPAAFFGLRISPGEVYPLETLRDVHITNIAFGEKVEGSARSVVKVHHIKFPNLEEDDDSDYDSDLMGDEDDEDDEDEDEDDVEDDVEIKDAAEEDDEDEDDDEDDDDDSDSGGVEEEEFVVCSLYPGKIEQCSVNLYFSNLEDVGFSVTGDNDVELLGNYMSPSHYDEEPSDSELFDSDDDEEIDSDEEAFAMEQSDDESDEEGRLEEIDEDEARAAKKAILASGNSKKRSSDEVDADESMLSAPATDAEIAAVAAAEGLDLSKLSKNQRKRLNKKLKGDEGTAVAAPAAAKAPEAKAQTSEKAKAKVEVTDARGKKVAEEKETVKKDGKEVSQKTKTASGLIIEDQKQGTGVAAKAGNRVGMRYVGRLQGKGTVFDSNTKGKPFFFKLGKGEVIKGWDEGVKGMKVGGERRLVCPPNLAYGRQGAPPTIPANATLVFDVKLVEIK